MSRRFVILDGSSLLFRAFYAMPATLMDSRGEATGAIVGFYNMLAKLLSDLAPDMLAIAFDKSRHTFRTDIFPEYKGTRKKTPEELVAQIPMLKELAAAHGIAFLEMDGYEADDIIGTLAVQAAGAGAEALVVTGDRDALQLVRPGLSVLMTKKGITDLKKYDEAAFKEEWGFEPIRLIDCKGLMGDSSDNIPGVPGVGQKTAQKLLAEYGSLEGVYENIDKVAGKRLKERLVENEEQARLSKRLATIELKVPGVSFEEADFAISPSLEKMRAFCERYELKGLFRSFEKLYGAVEKKAEAAAPLSYRELAAPEAESFVSGAERLSLAGVFSGRAPFLMLEELAISAGGELVLVRGEALARVLELLPSREVALLDFKRYLHAGLRGGKVLDLALMNYLLAPEDGCAALERLADKYLDEELKTKGLEPREAALLEASRIEKMTAAIADALQAAELKRLYDEMELPLVSVLASMEREGVYVNRAHLEEKAEELGTRIENLRSDIYTLAGGEFNINSSAQLADVLFNRLGLTPIKKTKTGYSTNAEVLEALREEHPIIELILAYRMWSKLKSTYLDGIIGLIDVNTGRVHTTFNQMVTATGRLSSSEPNLQNIPVRTEEGREIRALFEPGKGYDYMLSADYSQIELRVLAHISGDERFLAAFNAGEDIHARTAAEVFGVPLESVTREMRRHAKAVNFGIVYGMSDFGLAKDLHISRKEAASYIESYFERYPKVKEYLDRTVAEARGTGMVKTLFGRRRSLPGIKNKNFNQRALAERMAMNTPIQGTAADIIKLAMLRVQKALAASSLHSRLLLQVHDELVLEVREEELEATAALLREAMEGAAKLAIPLTAEICYGRTWAEAK